MAKETKKRAPLRMAKHWGKETPLIARKLILITVVVIVLGLLFSSVQGIETQWLRIAVTCLMLLVGLTFYYSEGVSKGSVDTGNSRQLAKAEKAGSKLTVKEDASCYHPLKALVGASLLFIVPLALAVIVAVNSEEYTYILQDLPTWLTGSYAYREDVLSPLDVYMTSSSAGVMDWLRVIVRLFSLTFVSLFSDPQRMSHTIDLLAPLFIAVYPLVYTVGYLRGPAEHAKIEKMNRKAKKIAARKHSKSKLAEELLGENNVPHYGHQIEKEKHKKKELI